MNPTEKHSKNLFLYETLISLLKEEAQAKQQVKESEIEVQLQFWSREVCCISIAGPCTGRAEPLKLIPHNIAHFDETANTIHSKELVIFVNR